MFKLLSEGETWQAILKRKYIGQIALSQVLWKPDDSHFLAGLIATKKFFFRLGSFSIKGGSEIRFWEYMWLDNSSLCEQYPTLYNILCHKGNTIVKVMEDSLNVTFRRDLSVQRLVSWNVILQRLANIQLLAVHEEFYWNLHENRNFSVASMYNVLIQPDVPIDRINHDKL
jgi:hypothetical protein